ncbi:MAG: hypothetical protein AABY22_09840 [Nanoarchaeota archaeon]
MIGKIVCAVLIVLVMLGFGFYSYYITYSYERDVGSHIENAYEVNTPDRMINEIKLAKQGMVDSGLTEDDYGALVFKKPDNSMRWQYDFLDSVIERAEAVQTWYNQTYGSGEGVTESLGDVYETKMDNLREFLKEGGRADWIARDAWLIKNHKVIYLEWIIWIILILILIGILIGMVIED